MIGAARRGALALCAALAWAAASANTPAELEPRMARVLGEQGLAGAVWATVAPDVGVRVGAAGHSDVALETNMSIHNRVQVGSIAKTVVALGVLRLVTQGRVTLDTPLATLLPELVLDNPWADTHPVRLRHLLDHTSGLDNLRLWQFLSLEPGPDTPLAQALQGSAALLRLRTPPGTRFAYSSMGYTVLGMVIEQLTGESYETFLSVEVLRVLGLRDTRADFTTQGGPLVDARLAMGHLEGGRAQPTVPLYLRPAVQLSSTAGDMARLALFLMGDGRVDGEVFIEPALLAAMGRAQGTEAAQAGLQAGYGLGLARRDRHGRVGLCHSGNTLGFRAMLCLYPELGKAFFVGVNTDHESARYEQLNTLLLAALGLPSQVPQPPPMGAAPPDIERWQGLYVRSPSAIGMTAGIDGLLDLAWLSWDGRDLSFSPLLAERLRLTPAGGALFSAAGRSQPSHVLLVSAQGQRVISDGLRSYEQASWPRLLLSWASVAAGLAGVAYVLINGLWRLMRRRARLGLGLGLAFVALLACLLTLPMFLAQSYLQLGDATLASMSLAVASGFLPVATLAGLMVLGFQRVYGRTRRRRRWRRVRRTHTKHRSAGPPRTDQQRQAELLADALALLALLQLCGLLMVWDLLPLRLWG